MLMIKFRREFRKYLKNYLQFDFSINTSVQIGTMYNTIEQIVLKKLKRLELKRTISNG